MFGNDPLAAQHGPLGQVLPKDTIIILKFLSKLSISIRHTRIILNFRKKTLILFQFPEH